MAKIAVRTSKIYPHLADGIQSVKRVQPNQLIGYRLDRWFLVSAIWGASDER